SVAHAASIGCVANDDAKVFLCSTVDVMNCLILQVVYWVEMTTESIYRKTRRSFPVSTQITGLSRPLMRAYGATFVGDVPRKSNTRSCDCSSTYSFFAVSYSNRRYN